MRRGAPTEGLKEGKSELGVDERSRMRRDA